MLDLLISYIKHSYGGMIKMEKNMIGIIVLILVLGLAVTSVALVFYRSGGPATTIAGGELTLRQGQQIPTINVRGESEFLTQPDKADLYIKIETQGKTAEDAQTENRDITNAVISSLKKNGVKADDIGTDRYYLNPQYDWERGRKIIGYTQQHVLQIEVTDLDKIGKLIDDAVAAGANSVERIQFGLTLDKKYDVTKEALEIAGKEAKKKAESIAGAMGVKLGTLFSVSESGVSPSYPVRYMAEMDEAVMAVGAAKAPTPISPEDITVRAYINVAYEIK
jgi:uncharacterized protein YggE